MQLALQTFQQLLQRMSAAVQKSGTQLVDMSVGSMLRAVLEANASIGLWLQWLIVQTLAMTRASTSTGTDLDSWMADFSLVRLPAVASQGIVTFSRLSSNLTATIPAGTQVKLAGGAQTFVVVPDSNNAAWQEAAGYYLLPVGVPSLDLPVIAQVPGASGNVMAAMISLISTAIPGVDFVTNAIALAGGADAENDDQFRFRFQNYINSRSRATLSAVQYAVSSIQQSMRYKIFENSDQTGAWHPGQFTVVVDDGSGQPNASLLAAVYSAVDAVRPIGSSFFVSPPLLVPVNIALTMSPGQLALSSTTIADVAMAITQYIDQQPIGATLSLTRIAEVAYRAARSPQNISGVSINGSSADLICSPTGVLRAGSVTVQ